MMTKLTCDLQHGDIIRCEYGDYGNWVTVEIESVTEEKGSEYLKICGHYVDNGEKVEMYSHKYNFEEVRN